MGAADHSCESEACGSDTRATDRPAEIWRRCQIRIISAPPRLCGSPTGTGASSEISEPPAGKRPRRRNPTEGRKINFSIHKEWERHFGEIIAEFL